MCDTGFFRSFNFDFAWNPEGTWILRYALCVGSRGILDLKVWALREIQGILDPEIIILHGIQGILDPEILTLRGIQGFVDPEILQWRGILWNLDLEFCLRHKSARGLDPVTVIVPR